MSDPSGHYLAGLRLSGRRVVVVGAGGVAQRRLPTLLEAGARVVLVAPHVRPAIEALVSSGEVEWTPRRYRDGDLEGAWYALALTDDPVVNAAIVAAAEARHVFCVRADEGAAGSAVTPATGHAGPVRVGVLGGGDPRRSAAVRDGIVEALREGRLDTLARRPPLAADESAANESAAKVGAAAAAGSASPTITIPGVVIVGGGPGDPDLITVRGRRFLAHADVVVADRLAPQALLAELPPHVEIVDAAKLPRGRAMAQEAINACLIERAREGKFVVRLKGGDPYVFGRGYEEVLACASAGVPVTVVPGVTSAIAVPGLAGIPLTHRGVAHEAVIVSGHLAPDDPESLTDWPALARLRGTLVLLMAVDRLPEIAAVLLEHGRDSATPTAIVQNGSLPNERVVRAALADLAETAKREAVRPPAIVVIGDVTALHGSK